jgi:hypothetical protein
MLDLDFSRLDRKITLKYLLILAINIFIIEIIWNRVIIQKFPKQHIQPITYFDAFALALFVSILSAC